VRQRSARDAIGSAGHFPGWLQALIATSIAFVLVLPVFVDRAAAAETQYARPVTSRLNVTGRAIDLPVELKDGDKPLGEVIIRIDPDDTVLIHKAALVEKLALVIDESTRTRLEAVQGQARVVTTNALSEAGFDVRFDAGLQELVFRPTVEQRPTGEISMAPARPQISANLARPAIMAGYVNVTAGIDHYWGGVPLAGQPGREASTIGRLEFDSAFRLWNVVIENRALYKSGAEPSLCPMTIACLYDQTGGFKRQSSRLVYDRPEDSLRLTAGDLAAFRFGYPALAQAKRDILAHGQPREKCIGLEHHAAIRARSRDLASIQNDAAACRPVKPGDDPEQRGFSAARRAEDGNEVVVADAEINRLQRPRRRIALARREAARDLIDPQLGHANLHGNSQALKALNRKSDTRPIRPMTMMPKMI